MSDVMTVENKMDYLLEMIEDIQNKVDQLMEAQEELVEKVADLGQPFVPGFGYGDQ